jgi:hypothetical protein
MALIMQTSEQERKRKTIFPPRDIKLLPEFSDGARGSQAEAENPVAKRQKGENSLLTRQNFRFKPQKYEKKPTTGDPWKVYQQILIIDQDVKVTVALKDSRVVRVNQVPSQFDLDWLYNLLSIRNELRNEHIIFLEEIFLYLNQTFFVYEIMHISLEDLEACNLQLTEPQITMVCRSVSSITGDQDLNC